MLIIYSGPQRVNPWGSGSRALTWCLFLIWLFFFLFTRGKFVQSRSAGQTAWNILLNGNQKNCFKMCFELFYSSILSPEQCLLINWKHASGPGKCSEQPQNSLDCDWSVGVNSFSRTAALTVAQLRNKFILNVFDRIPYRYFFCVLLTWE